MFSVEKYSESYKHLWNNFIAKSKNATFLFYRDFIEYHNDRFHDFSLLVFKDEVLIAIFPANKDKNSVCSHQGLTYGGIILSEGITFNDTLLAYKELLKFLHKKNVKELHLKLLPKIYHTLPSDELQYLLFKTKAQVTRTDVTSVIEAKYKLPIQSSNRKRGLKKALSQNLEVKEVDDFKDFWNKILIPNLKKAHQVVPVHSLSEITQLKSNFQKHIRQFNVYNNDKIVAGATVFDTKHVAHVQYISANADKQKLGSLDFLFDYLINNIFKTKKYFDFGISNINQGQQINEGLLSWKESFGARTIVHEFYRVETKNYVELNSVFV
ncbi:GNAT family N-acetyltransferase [Pontimicrobium aquaticum]|uniref:GNAT family N-acetyltransferase n=1 Tax=Pontimicrobium aquaticum TaxID=2565367 RepID=A0A4U0EWS8_9FLAO|nr:GNAT family N-acetyltransferase [Pontimicrobium aquaticum]